jgi:FkbM family methyltransferase
MLRVFRKLRHYYSSLGIRGVVTFLFAKLTNSKPLFRVQLPDIKHTIFLRIGTTDVSVMRQVLLEKHYDFDLPSSPRVIVDVGSNIGLAAVFFANKFPNATIVALEPEESNFRILERNVAPYPQVKPLMVALWNDNLPISLVDTGMGSHGFQTTSSPQPNPARTRLIDAITVDTLMSRTKTTAIDLLKIDIEGSEKEVFENSSDWMPKVGAVMVELHDHLKPGCTNAFLEATREFSEYKQKGETVFCLRTPTSTGFRGDAMAVAKS